MRREKLSNVVGTSAVFSDECRPLGHVTLGKPYPSTSLDSFSPCELVQGPAMSFKGSLSSARALSPLVTGDQGFGVLEAAEKPLEASLENGSHK